MEHNLSETFRSEGTDERNLRKELAAFSERTKVETVHPLDFSIYSFTSAKKTRCARTAEDGSQVEQDRYSAFHFVPGQCTAQMLLEMGESKQEGIFRPHHVHLEGLGLAPYEDEVLREGMLLMQHFAYDGPCKNPFFLAKGFLNSFSKRVLGKNVSVEPGINPIRDLYIASTMRDKMQEFQILYRQEVLPSGVVVRKAMRAFAGDHTYSPVSDILTYVDALKEMGGDVSAWSITEKKTTVDMIYPETAVKVGDWTVYGGAQIQKSDISECADTILNTTHFEGPENEYYIALIDQQKVTMKNSKNSAHPDRLIAAYKEGVYEKVPSFTVSFKMERGENVKRWAVSGMLESGLLKDSQRKQDAFKTNFPDLSTRADAMIYAASLAYDTDVTEGKEQVERAYQIAAGALCT